MTKPFLVLELNEQYLKLASFVPSGKTAKFLDCAVRPISGLPDADVAKLIRDFTKRFHAQPDRVIISLPRDRVTLRSLHLPSQDKKEIPQMIELYIGRIVPYKKEAVVFDYRSLGVDHQGCSKVLVGVVHCDVLQKSTRILDVAGLTADHFFLSTYGVWGWVLRQKKAEILPNAIYLLLDIDAHFVDYIIFSHQHILFSRSISMNLGDGFKDAAVTKLIGEIKQSLVIFCNEQSGKSPVKIFLSGARTTGALEGTVAQEFGLPVINVPRPDSVGVLVGTGGVIPDHVSLGAIAQIGVEPHCEGISFILPEMEARKALKEKTREMTVCGALAIYILMVLLAFFGTRFYAQQAYGGKLKQHLALISGTAGELLVQSEKVDFIKDFTQSRDSVLVFLQVLQKVVPEEIRINVISRDKANKYTLRGQAMQLSDALKFISSLGRSSYFSNVVTKYTRARKIADREISDFEITFAFLLSESKKNPRGK